MLPTISPMYVTGARIWPPAWAARCSIPSGSPWLLR